MLVPQRKLSSPDSLAHLIVIAKCPMRNEHTNEIIWKSVKDVSDFLKL